MNLCIVLYINFPSATRMPKLMRQLLKDTLERREMKVHTCGEVRGYKGMSHCIGSDA